MICSKIDPYNTLDMATFKTHTEFTAQCRAIAALHHLYNLVDPSKKSPSDVVPIAVFMAFSIEAYVNNLGARNLKIWDDLERLPWKTKISILHKERGQEPKWGEGPLKFAVELFKLRDKLAHGKAEKLEGPIFETQNEAFEFIANHDIEPKWFVDLDSAWIDQSKPRFDELMEYLARLFDLSPADYYRKSQLLISGPYE